MAKRPSGKLNLLERTLPPGLLVDASWLEAHGYSRSLRSQYVSAGWLEQPARRVYRRPTTSALTWQHAVVSLQTVLGFRLVVGGRTALELHGFAHYLQQTQREVHLYGPKPPPSWLHELKLDTRFVYHNSARLFDERPPPPGSKLNFVSQVRGGPRPESKYGVTSLELGGLGDWSLVVSTPERAILELLEELPAHDTFHQADVIMEGLTTLRPARLQELLAECKSVKVKRLFFFFADRHRHRWLPRLDRTKVDLGEGKRSLVRGGKLDRAYQITVPEDLHGVP
jgi:Transcriptional regulator, AbiEi antitoxin, Type IV TA system/Transcriptional regulator, AbiEi antitoxin N-terminal domain